MSKRKTITVREMKRRERENERTFPVGLIDEHNRQNKPCECCQRDSTRGQCFEDKDSAHICVRCYWTRTDCLVQ